jgi:hypothetical protein
VNLMAYSARVFRVLIASPSDVEEERDAVVSVIQAWNDLHSRSREIVLLPLRWETHTAPEFGTRPQDVINRAIVDRLRFGRRNILDQDWITKRRSR